MATLNGVFFGKLGDGIVGFAWIDRINMISGSTVGYFKMFA